jgi:ubiquinone/menaquinone biosynthesis C-methylase UbiE
MTQPDPYSVRRQNREAWQQMARQGHRLARPATREELQDPLNKVDSLGWLGGDIRGWSVLCLAAGGGRHGPLYAAAGAHVTVVDFSSAMLNLDHEVAAETGLSFRICEGSMDNLSMLGDAEFDLVIHPVSTCYVADVQRVFQEVARVTRPNGLYVSQHKQPGSLQASLHPLAGGYVISERYYRQAPLASESGSNLIREPQTQEYIHRWEELIGGMCRAGFLIEDLVEPNHADPAAALGSFGHRSSYLAPYVRIKARKKVSSSSSSKPKLIF